MGQKLATTRNRQHDGRALAKLSESRRQFVLMLMELGPTKKAAAKAAQALGMHPNYGYQLMRDEAVLAAIKEEATRKLTGFVLLGVKVIVEIAGDKGHKDQFRAAKLLTELSGFTTKQKIAVVDHVERDSETVIRDIRSTAKQLGWDPAPLLNCIGVTEAEDTPAD